LIFLIEEQGQDGLTRRVLRLALRAIRFANVRFGILPPQSASAGMTTKKQHTAVNRK
jgi:hypothetical protein